MADRMHVWIDQDVERALDMFARLLNVTKMTLASYLLTRQLQQLPKEIGLAERLPDLDRVMRIKVDMLRDQFEDELDFFTVPHEKIG